MDEKLSLQEWIELAQQKNMSVGDFCVECQARELEVSREVLLGRMEAILEVMEQSIEIGLSGIKSMGGLVGGNGKLVEIYRREHPKESVVGNVMSKAIMIALAVGDRVSGQATAKGITEVCSGSGGCGF